MYRQLPSYVLNIFATRSAALIGKLHYIEIISGNVLKLNAIFFIVFNASNNNTDFLSDGYFITIYYFYIWIGIYTQRHPFCKLY